jgi:UDP-GlcNAc:undecaprenyl-phosphate/decaprenyl-phosphate GlcNAc-1-phosphate transferase
MAVIGVLVIAFLASAAMQLIVQHVAIPMGLLDFPDAERRSHAKPVPRLGGIGVFVGLCIAAAVGAAFDSAEHVVALTPLVLAMAGGATILFAVGLADDIRGVPPLGKLIVQTVAALIVVQFGFRIDHVILPFVDLVDLGFLAIPITVLWIVGLSNAFNLIDGADGLAGGVAIIALIATAISAAVLNDRTILWCSLALIGAMLGFLRFNLPPARIFLGDSGSLLVGFLLAILTVKGMSRPNGAVFALAPIFALSYPLLDTGISMLRRWLRGEPLSRADGRHIHHQLQALGLGPRQTLMLVYSMSALVAVLGLSATFAPPDFTIAIAVAGAAMLVLIMVYGTRWLQYHELVEAGSSLASAVLTGRSRLQDNIYARDIARLIDQVNTTQELTAIIEENARTFRFCHMQLRRGMSRTTPPESIVPEIHAMRLWALDYPIIARSGMREPLFLSIWCSVDSVRTASAERVAQILAPAIERWIVRCRDQVSPHSFLGESPTLRFGTREAPADVARHKSNGASNGHLNGNSNGHSNGHANGHANGHTNGTANGHANGSANGHGNGSANGHSNGSSKGASKAVRRVSQPGSRAD